MAEDITAFLEACIQVYLWNRRVYAAHSFDQRRAFDLVVYQSRDQALVSYIAEGLRSASKHLRDGTLKQICAVLLDSRGQVAERLDISFVGHRQGRDLSSFQLAKDFARAALTRLSRLQLPTCNWSNFTLAFEVDDEDHEEGQEDASDTIVREAPVIGQDAISKGANIVVPIVSTIDATTKLRLVAQIQTNLLS